MRINETGCRESNKMTTPALRSEQDVCGTHGVAAAPPGSWQVAISRQQMGCEQTWGMRYQVSKSLKSKDT
jgi:hypothetical protein